MKNWRDASSLLFVVKSLATNPRVPTTNVAENFKILMLRRNVKSSFMPSKLVFPGGVISEADYSSNWVELFKEATNLSMFDLLNKWKLSTNDNYPLIKDNLHWETHPHIAFRIGAIRETFEESGLLLAIGNDKFIQMNKGKSFKNIKENLFFDDTCKINDWRNKVHKNPSEFFNMCKEYNILPNIWILHEWSNWLTPVFKRKDKPIARFDTLFYICCLQGDDVPLVVPDDKEIYQAHWLSPSKFLDENLLENDQKLFMAPPQIYELNKIKCYKHFDKLEEAATNGGHFNQMKQRFMPLFYKCQSGFNLILPGDYMYPKELDFNVVTYDETDKTKYLIGNVINSVDYDKPLHRIVYKDRDLHDAIIIKNLQSSL